MKSACSELLYKFNGMELQSEFGVNVYDFGARNYDPALGRWMNIDPLAEKFWSKSPYLFAFNNPIYYIDPDGMEAVPANSTSAASGGGGEVGTLNLNAVSGESSMQNSLGNNPHTQITNNGGNKPDPQYPDTSGVQELPEVVVVAKKKDKGCDRCPTGWGPGTQDLGNKKGTRQGDFDMGEMPTGTSGARSTSSRFMNFWRELLDILGFGEQGNDAIEKYVPNKSTMETNNEEPVDPPDEKVKIKIVDFNVTEKSAYGPSQVLKQKERDTTVNRTNISEMRLKRKQDSLKAYSERNIRNKKN